jgi:hypothetical protein
VALLSPALSDRTVSNRCYDRPESDQKLMNEGPVSPSPDVVPGCEQCKHIKDYPDLPHCVRKCEHCGRIMQVREPGDHGIGLRVREGDQFTLPAGSIRLSLDPRLSSGQFTKKGLHWFGKFMILNQLPDKSKRESMSAELETAANLCLDELRKSPMDNVL